MLTVTTPAGSRRLTRKENVKREMPDVPAASDDAFLDSLVDAASSAVERFVHGGNPRVPRFPRQVLSETLPGYAEVWLTVERTPIVSIAAILYDSTPITDFLLDDPEAGMIYRQVGWYWTAQVFGGLVAKQRWPGIGDPLPRQEEPRFTVNYTAGYLVPGQDLVAVTTVSVSAVDNSFNDSANGFPALLQAGDVIVASGFTNAGNNGSFVVVGTPTSGKVLVTPGPNPMVTEAAGSARTVLVNNLPPDVEKATIEVVKDFYLNRQKTPHSRRERVGEQDLEWTDPMNLGDIGVPVTAAGLLRAYQRVA